MTTITIERELPERWLKTLEFIEGCNGMAVLDPTDLKELLEGVRAALAAPATTPDELEQLRKDAERYQWLRAQHWSCLLWSTRGQM